MKKVVPDPPSFTLQMLNSAIHCRWTVPPPGARLIITCMTISLLAP